jgi:hypothetical protein
MVAPLPNFPLEFMPQPQTFPSALRNMELPKAEATVTTFPIELTVIRHGLTKSLRGKMPTPSCAPVKQV